MLYQPFNLKISYNQKLDIQFFLRHQLNDHKFKRHWIFCKGFDLIQEKSLLRNFIGFLNQGDLYKFKSSNFNIFWKEKTYQENIQDQHLTFSSDHQKQYNIDFEKQIISIEQQFNQNQYDQMCIISLFMSEDLQQDDWQKIRDLIENLKNSNFLFNIYIPERFLDQVVSDKAWIRIYTLQEVKKQMKGMFAEINKIKFKRISVNLKCLDGDIVLAENACDNRKTRWEAQDQEISNIIYFPACNCPYIMSVQMKNLMKTQMCTFEIELKCQDESNNISRSTKQFSLKPRRQFIDWIQNQTRHHQLIKQNNYQQFTLSFDEINLNQKLAFMRIYGTPGRILLKKRAEV